MYYISIKKGILEKKHIKAIGKSIWLYLWFLDRMTVIDENQMGKVLGGKPIIYTDVEPDLGFSQNSYYSQLNNLIKNGYITATRTPYGNTIKVVKAAKFFNSPHARKEPKEYIFNRDDFNIPYGENHPNWKGGVSSENDKIRKSLEYRLWRAEVFERDHYTCVKCGQVGGQLNADHIEPFAINIDLRFDIENGQTLCIECHKKKTKNDMRKISEHKKTDNHKSEKSVPKKVISSQKTGDLLILDKTEDKTIDNNSVAKPRDELKEQISKLYYDAVKALGLPVTNHNVIRVKINAMCKEDDPSRIIAYLNFVKDKYKTSTWDYKPQLNSALDIYSKRISIENSIRLSIEKNKPRIEIIS